MNIETVKLQGEGYLVNGTMSVPKVEGNRHYKLVQEWIAEGNTPEPEFTPEELTAKAELEAEQEASKLRAEAMLTGFEYNGHQISVTAEDGTGLLQVKGAFEMGVTDTVIHFENGTKLPMSASDFTSFALLFVTERNKYFV